MFNDNFKEAALGFPTLRTTSVVPKYTAPKDASPERIEMFEKHIQRYPHLTSVLMELEGYDSFESPTVKASCPVNLDTHAMGIAFFQVNGCDEEGEVRQPKLANRPFANAIIVPCNSPKRGKDNVDMYTNVRFHEQLPLFGSTDLVWPNLKIETCVSDSRIVNLSDTMAAFLVSSVFGQTMPKHHMFARPAQGTVVGASLNPQVK